MDTSRIRIKESRIGQPKVILDQFSPIGDWSLFYIPDPKFNEYPAESTAYYYGPFAGQVEFRDETSDDPVYEYGMRWKKTFGKSDISFMAASLLENDYTYRLDGFTAAGKMLIARTEQRFSMVGMTFNYTRGNFLYKGEIGKKMPRSFNDESYRLSKETLSIPLWAPSIHQGGSIHWSWKPSIVIFRIGARICRESGRTPTALYWYGARVF